MSKTIARPSQEIIDAIANANNVSHDEALALINFDRTFKPMINGAFVTAATAKDVELAGGVSSGVAEAVESGLGAVPIFGGLLSFLGFGGRKAIQATERAVSMNGYENLTALTQNETQQSAEFVRVLSSAIIAAMKGDVIDIYNNSSSDKKDAAVKKLAEEKAKILIEHMKDGNCSGMTIADDPKPLLANLLRAAGLEKSIKNDEVAFSDTPSKTAKDAEAFNVVEEHAKSNGGGISV